MSSSAPPMPPSAPHLQRHTVRELLSAKKDPIPLVDIANVAPVEEALDLLLAGDILTLPVYAAGTESAEKQYIGFVSAYDLLTFLTLHASSTPTSSTEPQTLQLSQALRAPIQDVLDQASISSGVPYVSLDESVHTLMAEMSHLNQQRALILAPNTNKAPEVVSETDLARFLTQHFDILGSQLDATIEELIARQPALFQTPATIPLHTTAWAAFQKLNKTGINALAVVDRYGEIVAECSATELRGLNLKRLEELNHPILVYLRDRAGGEIPEPFTCRRTFTLSQCLAGMVRFDVHRAWILDEDNAPLYELTLSNILRLFL